MPVEIRQLLLGFTEDQFLTMAGTDWTWAGTGTFSTALVQSGTLNLTGTLGTTTASVVATVNAGGEMAFYKNGRNYSRGQVLVDGIDGAGEEGASWHEGGGGPERGQRPR